MKTRIVLLAVVALLALGGTVDSAFAWGAAPIGVYLCPVTHPHLSCNPLTGNCLCY